MFGKKSRGAWSNHADEPPSRYSFTGIIKAIIEVVPGGVLRAGKTAYSDDANVGFWLGVDTDSLAKFNIGSSTFYLKWTGSELHVKGTITWAGGKGVLDESGLGFTEDANNYLLMNVGGSVSGALVEIRSNNRTYGLHVVNADLGVASYGIGAETSGRGAAIYGLLTGIPPIDGQAAIKGQTSNNTTGYTSYAVHGRGRGHNIGVVAEADASGYALQIVGANVDGGSKRYTSLADAVLATDALNRQTGDARYLQQSAGWTGTFATGDGRTATVVNGQITAVA